MPDPQDITLHLHRLAAGDPGALDQVVRLLYDELRVLARSHLRRERAQHTLGNTALVNELYLRLSQQERIAAGDRSQFFKVAAVTMRRLLVDYARMKRRLKRGAGAVPVPLDVAEADAAAGLDQAAADALLADGEADEILAVDAALARLAAINPRGAAVVQQRFYVGSSLEEIAATLGVSVKTVQRDWLAARAWLRKEVRRELDL